MPTHIGKVSQYYEAQRKEDCAVGCAVWILDGNHWKTATVIKPTDDATQELVVQLESSGKEVPIQLHSDKLRTTDPDDSEEEDEYELVTKRLAAYEKALKVFDEEKIKQAESVAELQKSYEVAINVLTESSKNKDKLLLAQDARLLAHQAKIGELEKMVDELQVAMDSVQAKLVTPESVKKLKQLMDSVNFDKLVDGAVKMTSPRQLPDRSDELQSMSLAKDFMFTEIETHSEEKTDDQGITLIEWAIIERTWRDLLKSYLQAHGIPLADVPETDYWPFASEPLVRRNRQYVGGFVERLSGVFTSSTPELTMDKISVSVEPVSPSLQLSTVDLSTLPVRVVALLTKVCVKAAKIDIPAAAEFANRTYGHRTRAAAVAAHAAIMKASNDDAQQLQRKSADPLPVGPGEWQGDTVHTPGSTESEYQPSPMSSLVEYRDHVLITEVSTISYEVGDKLGDWFEFIDWDLVDQRHWTNTVGFICKYDPSEHHPDKRGDSGRASFGPMAHSKDASGNVLVALTSEMIKLYKNWPRDSPVPTDDSLVNVKSYKHDKSRVSINQLFGSLYIVAAFPPPLLQPREFQNTAAMLEIMRNNQPGYPRHDVLVGNVDIAVPPADRPLFWHKQSLVLRNAAQSYVGNYGTVLAPGPASLLPSSGGGPASTPTMMWHALCLPPAAAGGEHVVLLGVTDAPSVSSASKPAAKRKRKLVFKKGAKRKAGGKGKGAD